MCVGVLVVTLSMNGVTGRSKTALQGVYQCFLKWLYQLNFTSNGCEISQTTCSPTHDSFRLLSFLPVEWVPTGFLLWFSFAFTTLLLRLNSFITYFLASVYFLRNVSSWFFACCCTRVLYFWFRFLRLLKILLILTFY